MQATSSDMAMLARYGAAPSVTIDLSLPRLSLPPAWRPVLLAWLRVAMGAGVGMAFGVAAGHGGFWVVVGAGLGAVLEAVARRG